MEIEEIKKNGDRKPCHGMTIHEFEGIVNREKCRGV